VSLDRVGHDEKVLTAVGTGVASPTVDETPMPKVTPYLLRRADTMCRRRLAEEVTGGTRADDPVNRSRLRDAFLARARDVHAELRVPSVPDFDGAGAGLEAEERAVLAHAARWYVEVFGDRPAIVHDHGLEQPSESRARDLRIGGWVDLTVVDADGRKELRQLDLWCSRVPVHALDPEAVRLAVLRLSRWFGADPLRVVWADLVRGNVLETTVGRDDVDELRGWFDARVAVIGEAVHRPVASNGADCAQCNVVAGCAEHGNWHGRARNPRGDVRPAILRLSPTSLAQWERCPREWRNRLLAVPASDGPGPSAFGNRVHALLKLTHEEGSCRDPALVDDVLTRHQADDEHVRVGFARHAERCPAGATAIGHEITRARFASRGRPFMASARFDALWVHDGLLDAHDYKTGGSWDHQLHDDVQARVQAWVLEPLARARGLRPRITFEYLSPEVSVQPAPFDPEPEDLDAIGDALRGTVAAMHAEVEFAGVADPDVCSHCDYRSICPDSAAPSQPVWPVFETEDDEPEPAR
jgi:hypothetical protein